jgi:DNA-binding transcriptional LysR family regulator
VPAFSRFLRYFLAVGTHGSIRKAAEELHVSPSAVDRQILQAEAELGVLLFERRPTGLRLTAAGELMMAAGGRWQKGLGEVRAQIDDLRGLKRGHVEIAVIDALAKGLVPTMIKRVQAGYPGITIGVKVLDNIHVRGAIARGDVDFGIMLDPQATRELTVRAHVDVALGFVTRPGHPIAERPARRFSASTGHRLVVPAEPLALCQQVTVLAGTTGVTMDVAASSDNIQMIKSLVAQDVGVGILTSLDVIGEVAASDLAFVRISDPILRPLTLALCIATARQLSSAANLVLAEVETHFDRFGYDEAG